jgi:hypothetical protein
MQLHTLFPLTPALSLRERENGWAVAGKVTVSGVRQSGEKGSLAFGRELGWAADCSKCMDWDSFEVEKQKSQNPNILFGSFL